MADLCSWSSGRIDFAKQRSWQERLWSFTMADIAFAAAVAGIHAGADTRG